MEVPLSARQLCSRASSRRAAHLGVGSTMIQTSKQNVRTGFSRLLVLSVFASACPLSAWGGIDRRVKVQAELMSRTCLMRITSHVYFESACTQHVLAPPYAALHQGSKQICIKIQTVKINL